MRLKNLAVALFVCMGALAAQKGFADTLTLEGTSGQAVGGVYVYPYNMSLNGSTTTIPMMCINYDHEITEGETWQVTGQRVTSGSSDAFKKDAWLYSQVGKGTYALADIQFAVWDILDPGVGGNSGLNSVALNLVTMAQNAVDAGLSDNFLNQYAILSPVTTMDAQATWTKGIPQSFIVSTSAVTPEPSSLLLLGTGLGCASLLLMRRRALQENNSL